MASLSEDKGRPPIGGGKRAKLFRILFKGRDGRQCIRLGEIPVKQARTILSHVEHLERCLLDGSAPPTPTAAWLADSIHADLRAKLVDKGLAAPKVAERAPTIGELVAAYKGRPKWNTLKPSSQRNKLRAFDWALAYFGAGCRVRAVTAAGGMDFYAHLHLPKDQQGRGLGLATANLAASCLYTLFNYAIDDELLDRNPFKALPRQARKGANANVGVADSLLVLDAMQGSEARLLFGLARWGGLRTPSEPRGIRWCDVDRERERFLVHSPKTERHEGRETRWVPIFPELQPLFQDRYDEAEPGEAFVLPSLRHAADHRATTLLRGALSRCGVEAWPRIWHSLRATRQTELAELFPAHVVAGWLGNTVAVADRHYLMTTDDHFARAAQKAAQPASANGRQGETSKGSGKVRPSINA